MGEMNNDVGINVDKKKPSMGGTNYRKRGTKKGGRFTKPGIAGNEVKEGGRGSLVNLVGKVRKSVKKRMIKRPKSVRNMYKQFSVIPRYRKTKGLNLLDKYIPKVMKQ